jgi:DNA modification methylase
MNKLLHGDCLELMKDIPNNSIDLVVTSPPYDDLKTYNGTLEWSFEIFKGIANQLQRVIKKGGVIVWVVADATIKGSETGSSFRQALYFKELGLNLHDTMIWTKNRPPLTHNRYEQTFEYMFVFSKQKLKTFNPIEDKPNKWKGTKFHGNKRDVNGVAEEWVRSDNKIKDFGRRLNVWDINNVGKAGTEHPAPFPVKLANDHILSWSNKGDVILDPFMGSGTTGVAAKNLNRKFIGIEKDDKYFNIARERIKLV